MLNFHVQHSVQWHLKGQNDIQYASSQILILRQKRHSLFRHIWHHVFRLISRANEKTCRLLPPFNIGDSKNLSIICQLGITTYHYTERLRIGQIPFGIVCFVCRPTNHVATTDYGGNTPYTCSHLPEIKTKKLKKLTLLLYYLY